MGKVALEKCQDYAPENVRAALLRCLEPLGGMRNFVKPGMKVALKPNLVMKLRPEAAGTTHPSMVREVALLVKEAGGEPIVVESPGGPYTQPRLRAAYDECGLTAAAQGTGLRFNFDLAETKTDNPQAKYLRMVTVLKPLRDAELIINLCKLKTHGQMAYTGAVKNMFGAIAGPLKAEFHMRMADYDRFANAIIDIHLAVKPALNIMDAVTGMHGRGGPTAGDPIHIGLLLASDNAFELDLAALAVVGGDPHYVPVMKEAIERKLCPPSVENLELCGERIEDVKVAGFRMPQAEALKAITFFDHPFMRFLCEKIKPKPVFLHDKCIGCGDCAANCPAKIIKMTDRRPEADLSRCIRCFCCQELCPAKAVDVSRLPGFDLAMDLGSRFFTAVGPFLGRFKRRKRR
ncbi:MAG TPA: DUF362 domain-containing protein [Elusimicrobiales bacterium]|nr:DUF362 domain-containing protein [Elusimicrobiales bacterium]